jgi:hypothetical protein
MIYKYKKYNFLLILLIILIFIFILILLNKSQKNDSTENFENMRSNMYIKYRQLQRSYRINKSNYISNLLYNFSTKLRQLNI